VPGAEPPLLTQRSQRRSRTVTTTARTGQVSTTLWTLRPHPALGSGAFPLGHWQLATAADVTASRSRLRDAVLSRRRVPDADGDALERLLLAFEELASNGLRHGRPPVQVRVTGTDTGWLIDVADCAPDRPPTPAVDRDAADGGLGLYLVARLCTAHGWTVEQGRKHVWACIERAVLHRAGNDAGRR
jgi:anti-sigma regulatory factor (Ser/Thr protein kinase)